jgi:hypothetical protein
MTEREDQVNQGLRSLDDAHRLGRISREDYRARRRALLGSLRDSQGITARNTLRRPKTGAQGSQPLATPTSYAGALESMFNERPGVFGRKRLLWLAAAAGVAVLLLYVLLRRA